MFNSNYHDIAKDLDALHKENVHSMISVWGLLGNLIHLTAPKKTVVVLNLLEKDIGDHDEKIPEAIC